jgi:hypothetical protein
MAKWIWADRVKQTAGSAPNGGATTFDVNTSAASGGFIKFESMPGLANGDLVFYRAHAGSLFECGYGAIDTSAHTLARTAVTSNSSGTTSKVDFSAGSAPELVCDVTARVISQMVLPNIAGSDAAKTMDVGVNNEAPVGSFTADRIYTFPPSPNDGDQFEVTAVTGSATYECILKTNSDKAAVLLGTTYAAGTVEVTRLLMAGDRMRWRFNATADKWLCAQDDRVPITVIATSAAQSMVQNTQTYPNWGTRTVDNSSAYVDAALDYFVIRRAGTFLLQSSTLTPVLAANNVASGELVSDPNGTPTIVGTIIDRRQAVTADRLGVSVTREVVLAVDTQVTSRFVQSGSTGNWGAAQMSIRELLK